MRSLSAALALGAFVLFHSRVVCALTGGSQLSKRATKPRAVFAHVMFGEVQGYTVEDHASDMRLAASVGIDAFAINTGHDTYDAEHVANVFKAAKETGFQLFFSFDMLHYNQKNASNWILYDYLQPYALTDEHYKIDGKPVISTFGGNQDGQYLNAASSFEEANAAWNDLFSKGKELLDVDFYYSPFWETPIWKTDVGDLQISGVGNWYSWGIIGGTGQVTADSDVQWHNGTSALGIDYWAPVSAQFSVHQVADRNYVYSSGNFLLPTHYEDLINLGDDAPEYIELITFSDWGESTYLGPSHNNSSPPSETIDTALYVRGHDHLPFLKLAAYYNYWYKNGAAPTIISEAIFWWTRGHPVDAKPSNDPLPQPDGASALTDTIYVVVLVPSGSKASKLVVTTGGAATEAQDVKEGVNMLMTDFKVGKTGVSLQDENGNEVLSGSGVEIIDNPEIYDYNYYAFSVPADVAVSDFLDTGSSSSVAASKAKSASTTTASGMATSLRASSTSGPSSSSTASSSSPSWWVWLLVAVLSCAALALVFLYCRNRSLTDRDGLQHEASQDESESSSPAPSSVSDDSSSTSSAASTSSSYSSSRSLRSFSRRPDRRPTSYS